MIHKFGWIALLGVVILGGIWKLLNPYAYDPPVLFYNRAGQILNKKMKVWSDTLLVTSANPSINISSAGFSTIINAQAQIVQTSATVNNFTWCNVSSYTTSSVSLFLTQENSSTVNILGSVVLLGTPLQQPSSPSNTYVALQIFGY